MMRIVSTEGALRSEPAGHDRSVNVDGQCAQGHCRDLLRHEVGVEVTNPLHGSGIEPGHPAPDRPGSRKLLQAAEATNQRISFEELDVTHTPATEDDQGEQHPNHRDDAEIRGQARSTQPSGKPPIEIDALHVSREELEPGERGESLGSEFQMERTVDTARQIGFSSSH